MKVSSKAVEYDCGNINQKTDLQWSSSKNKENENLVNVKLSPFYSEDKRSFKFDFFNKVEDFINNHDTYTDKEIINILKIFKHSSIEYLFDLFNYDKSILKLSSYLMHLAKIGVNNDSLNDYFWNCMDLRLEPRYSRLIYEWMAKADLIENKLTEKLNDVKKKYLNCSICKENQVSVLFLPCGHVIVCSKCHEKKVRNCQACSTPINEYHTIYM